MAITTGSNISSLRAQRTLGQTGSALSKTFERLSTGQRINRAADDAAGLSVVSKLRTDHRVYAQGIRNLNDGLSALNIADDALENLSSIVMRLQELAEQSANGVYGKRQRESIDAEAQALSDEYFRISKSVKFNGLNLFDGSLEEIRLQAGYGTDGGIASGVGGAIGTGSFGARTSFEVVSRPLVVTLGDLNGDSALDMVTVDSSGNSASVLMGKGDGTFATKTSFGVGNGPRGVTLGDLNGDGVLDMVTADFSGNKASVLIGKGDGTFGAKTQFSVWQPVDVDLGDLNGDGVLDMVTQNVLGLAVVVLIGNGDGTFGARTNFFASNPLSVTLGDLNGDGVLDIVTGGKMGFTVNVLIGNGNGTFGAQTTFSVESGPQAVTLGDLNGDGVLDIVAANTAGVSVLIGIGDGTFCAKTSFSTNRVAEDVVLGDLNGDGVLDIVTADYIMSGPQTTSVLLAKTKDGVSPLLPFDLTSMAGARQAQPVFQQKLDQLGGQRGQIGAFQSRLGVAVSVLSSSTENMAAASSRIMDADVAEEAAKLVRTQILQQAGAAVLAQANQQSALVLTLLQGA